MANEGLNEKVSVNVNTATLSAIDLLVDNGYYSNRSDFINQALREALQRQQRTIDRIVDSHSVAGSRFLTVQGKKLWFMGVYVLSAAEVEELCAAGKQVPITGYGMLTIEKDCDLQKLFAAVSEIKVKGKVLCSPEVKEHYGL